MRNRVLGIHIEGIAGTCGGTATKGDFFCEEAATTPAHDYDWVPVLTSVPDSISSRVNPFRGAEYDLSGLTARLQATEEVLERLIPIQRRAPAELRATVTRSATEIQITPAGAIDGGLIWIGDECVRLTSKTTPGAYDQFTAARGIALTRPEPHTEGTAIFSKPQYLRGRVVRLMVSLDGGDPEILGTYKWATRKTANSQTELELTTREFLKTVDNARLFEASRQFFPGLSDIKVLDGQRVIGFLPYPDENYLPVTPKTDFMFLQIAIEDVHYIVRARRVRVLSSSVILDTVSVVGGEITASGVGIPFLRNQRPNRELKRIPSDAKIHEIIYVNRRYGDPGTFDAIAYPYDPAAIVFALLCSTGRGDNNPEDPDNPGSFIILDVLAQDIGLGIPVAALDYPSFHKVITRRRYKIDQLKAGTDGERIDAMEIVPSLLQRFNLFLAPRRGKLALGVLETFSVDGANDVANGQNGLLIPPSDPGMARFEFDFREDDTVARLTGEVGGNVFEPARSIEVNIYTNRAESLMSGSSERISYATMFAAAHRQAAQDLAAKIELRAVPPPVLPKGTFMLEHDETVGGFTGGHFPSVGEWVRILRGPNDEITLISPEGPRVDPNDDSNWLVLTGMVLGEEIDLDTWVVTADVMLLNWAMRNLLRLIAPSGRILSSGESGGGGVYYVRLAPDLLLAVDDSHGFWDPFDIQTDNVDLWRPNGTLWGVAKSRSVVDIDGDDIYIDDTAVVPPVGTILRLSHIADFENFAWAGAGVVPPSVGARRYVYVADENDQVFDPSTSTDITGDIYGAGPASSGNPPATIYGGDTFLPLDSRAYRGVDTQRCPPFDVWLLTMMDARARRNARTYGQCFAPFLATGHSPSSVWQNRPYVSTRRWTSILRIPWLVQPGEVEIVTNLAYRVSNGGNDQSKGDGTQAAYNTVEARGYLLGRYGQGDHGGPLIGIEDDGAFVWGNARIRSSVSAGDLVGPQRDTYVLDIAAEPIANPAFQPGFSEAAVAPANLNPYVEISSGTFYTDDTAATSPGSTSNWITATRIQNSESFFESATGTETWHDHVYAASNKKMAIWPLSEATRQSEVRKFWVPYLQLRGVGVQSLFDAESGVDPDLFRSLQAPTAAAVAGLAQAANSRPIELCVANLQHHHRAIAGAPSGLTDRKFPYLCPHVIGASSTEWRAGGYCRFDRPRFYVLIDMVCSHYAVAPFDFWRAQSGDGPLGDAEKYMARGRVNIAVRITQDSLVLAERLYTDLTFDYFPSTLLSPSPFLQTVACMGPNGDGLTLREGMMSIDFGAGPDAGVFEKLTLEIEPFRFDRNLPFGVTLQITQHADPEWAPESEGEGIDLLQADMRVDVVGFAVWAGAGELHEDTVIGPDVEAE